jgi:hypothetical protein
VVFGINRDGRGGVGRGKSRRTALTEANTVDQHEGLTYLKTQHARGLKKEERRNDGIE